ncbi:hypothetical protein J1782_08290 [Rahnella sp. BCC 1045]|uniref:hypothetical protein n=1 Tax=Rahnella sp. BCC 1045 TaxID=2816251 RepID=UPI001C25854E|nr:hypothetical protein [Rahnella sp. BCC 1045]MBU9819884.1 hypothetical protein [Rahnella sp. BCC 1045]
MTTYQSYVFEFNRLRLLGFSRLEATGLVLVDPIQRSVRVLWRICIVIPLFIVGALTVSLWLFLPAEQVGEVVGTCISDDSLMDQFGAILLLAGAVLEGMRHAWQMNASLLAQVSTGKEYGQAERKDKNQ